MGTVPELPGAGSADAEAGTEGTSHSPSSELLATARAVLDRHWRPDHGFTVPHAETYPWQWLWDSCFHAVVWTHLGSPTRALRELTACLAHQDEVGFVPHLTYWGSTSGGDDDTAGPHAELWGRRATSSITQPPVYGHAIAELLRAGVAVDRDLIERARLGLEHLLGHRGHPSGLVALCHPWESGADDSPRWDDWCPGGFDGRRWYERKGELVATIRRGPTGAPVANPEFDVAPVGFAALVAWNARELGEALDDRRLVGLAGELAARLRGRWDPELRSWVDAGAAASGSGRCRTLDALLPVLVDEREEVLDAVGFELTAEEAYGSPYGPRGVHRAEHSYRPRAYWRGPAWPQLTYLLWRAFAAHGRTDVASWLADRLTGGAVRSGFAEYWDPESGAGLGAIPQSWATLAVVVI